MFPGGMSFDTLSYARRLKQAGLPEAQAEAIADATRELVVQDVATKADIAAVRADMAALRAELKADIAALRSDMAALEQRLTALIETQALRLTVRLGGLIAIGIAILAAIIKL
jgi:hypothetical protein